MISIHIQRGIPSHYHQDVVDLYYSECERFVAGTTIDANVLKTVLAHTINWDYALYAFIDSKLAGVAGFQIENQSFTSKLTPPQLLKLIGLKAWLSYAWNLMLNTPQPLHLTSKSILRHNGLVVADHYKRLGVGETLLNALASFAQHHGFEALSLNVERNNQAATSLYLKLGYQTVKRSKKGQDLMLRELKSRILLSKCSAF
ncbi:GNAT family N-acetyltransferase [Marinomonas mediterranea]|jgi:Acetyltransferases|uniref:GCN5-related N-acetyltransferase n=1 Tax=Marinomonas mediterranea (strain ATCC 700492 / JCM 21426 / NBRC 103028 / MMB-1) TaxID=717774 RepID=F2JWZ8_MARM1|nr:GNAT family N-acetyltransferase [Marinomonas mediterranea]ADZ89517.1 GCN5-related N-acetyltransferase [Marinomonas mediterranea MMB-1]WCN15762.1 GNAT family N-acetyltransferase [Marinomonas mediterranea MMB-1]